MAQDEDDRRDGPSLELPSFGLRRRSRPRQAEVEPVSGPPEPTASEPLPAYAESLPTLQPPPRPAPRPEASPSGRAWSTLPALSPLPATLVAGLLVGLLTTGLVRASQDVCEVARGTSSCGNAGFVLLLAVLVLAGWVGSLLLRAFGVAGAASTSALAVALLAVVLMLVLGDQLFAWWMVLAVPAVAMGCFALSHRVTSARVEPGGPELRR